MFQELSHILVTGAVARQFHPVTVMLINEERLICLINMSYRH